jgi:arginine exporter protein ArgO
MVLAISAQGSVWPLRVLTGGIQIVCWEGAMSPKELKKLKEAAEKIRLENNTPEKARAFLIKIGYLNPDGQVAERFR